MAKNPALRAVSGGSAKAANRGGPFPGGKAPAFRWPRDGGGTVGLADFARRKQPMAYGQQKTLYGRKFMGTVLATFLIGPDGHIAQVWPKVSVAGHAQDVLDAAKSL